MFKSVFGTDTSLLLCQSPSKGILKLVPGSGITEALDFAVVLFGRLFCITLRCI